MKNCPQCQRPREGEDLKCPICDVFYSELDQMLYEDLQREESKTWKGAWKRVVAAENRRQALIEELRQAWCDTPLKTKIVLLTVAAFVFVLVVPI